MNEQAAESIYTDIIEEILDKYGYSEGNYPTVKWIAGKFRELKYLPSYIHSLNSGKVSNPELIEKYSKFKTLAEKSIQHKLMVKDAKNQFHLTETGRKFIQVLMEKFQNMNFDNWKEVRRSALQADSDVHGEWVDALPPEEKELANVYGQLTPKTFFFLKGLLTLKDKKKNYSERVDSYRDSHPEEFQILLSTGLVDDKYMLNAKKLDALFTFLGKYTPAQLRNLNKEMRWTAERAAAYHALTRNLLAKMIDSGSSRSNAHGVEARNIIETATPTQLATLKKLQNQQILRRSNVRKAAAIKFLPSERQYLREINALNNAGNITGFGEAIVALLSKRDTSTIDTDETDTLYSRIDHATGQQEKAAGFEKTDRLKKRSEKAQGRNSMFSDFIRRN